MAKLTIIQKSRKPFKCMGPCQKEIPKGSQYRRWSQNYRSDHVRCMECPTPSRSFFTTSEILSMAWDIADQDVPEFENYEDFTDTIDEIESAIQEIVDVVQEKQDNIEQGFGHTQIQAWEELDERRGLYEDWYQGAYGVKDATSEEEWDPEAAQDAFNEFLGECPE